MEKPDVRLFSVGEEINPESWHIRIRITAINPEDATLEAIVIRAEDAFSGSEYPGTGFVEGMELKFDPRWPNFWVPCEKHRFPSMGDLPWFELLVTSEGKKIFKHYR